MGRGSYLEAGLSAGAAVPFAGDAAQAVAMVRKVVSKGADFAASAGKSIMKLGGKFDNVDEIAEFTRLRKWQYGEVPPGWLGKTDAFGNITIRPGLTGRKLEETVRHESVHSFFSPSPGLLGNIRAYIGLWAYKNVHLAQYLEEAIAETYGTGSLLIGLSFPIRTGYVSAGRVILEGAAYTAIVGASAYVGQKIGEALFI